MKAKCIMLILLVAVIPCTVSAMDIIGTGKNQTEALNSALFNLSQLVSSVEVSTRFTVDRRMHNDSVDVDARELFWSESAFYIENVRQYVTALSENRVVISLSDGDIDRLREMHRKWMQRPDIEGSVKVMDGRAIVVFREMVGCPVTVRSVKIMVMQRKTSLLCSEWVENQEDGCFEMLERPVKLARNRNYRYEQELPDNRISLLDIGKKVDRIVSVVVRGVDQLGREVEVEL